MTKQHCSSFLAYLLIWSILLGLHALSAQKKNFTYEQVYQSSGPEVLSKLPIIDGWLDGDHYLQYLQDTEQKISRLVKVRAADGRIQPFIDYQSINDRILSGFDLRQAEDVSRDYLSYILSKDNDLYSFSLSDSSLHRLTASPEMEKNPVLSPDGHYVAFTRDHDLYIIDIISGEEKRLTSDGDRSVYNGWAAWIYYEEILGRSSHYQAFWWSPNSESIAFLHFDETDVPEFPLFNAAGVHGRLELQRYPKAGDPLPQVRLGIIQIKKGIITWADFNQGVEHYLAQPFWSPDSKFLLAQWFNRAQDLARLYRIDPATGQKKLVYEEKSQTWIEFYTDLYILADNTGFILRTDRDGWYHLYYYNMEGRLQFKLTGGKWNVSSVKYVDETNKQVYFIATAEQPVQKHFYQVNFSGKDLQRLTSEPGVHEADISPTARFFIDKYSNMIQPPKIDLFLGEGKFVRCLGDSKIPALVDYELGRVEIFSIPTEDGFDLPALWILPPGIEAGKSYPVIFVVYGGPESVSVQDKFRNLHEHYLAQRGIITMVVDNRGAGHFGKTGMMAMNRQLGKWEVDDLVTAVKWLRKHPFIDSTRVGITGSSYGGYTTCMALTYGADYFTHGVAALSVTDWKLYDAVYTERYMDRPQENPQGYEFAAVMSHVPQYKGKLLIICGSMDDNVHYQNTLQLASKFQDLGKKFELMIYPDERHGIRGLKRLHADRLIHDFWIRNFLGSE
jgi:dipeptidyl-peptidase-4